MTFAQPKRTKSTAFYGKYHNNRSVYRNGFTSPKDMQFQRSQAPKELSEEDKKILHIKD